MEKLSKFLFYLNFVLLCIPLVFGVLSFKVEWGKLDGAFHLRSKPAFSSYGWLKGHYQEDFDKYINDQVCFRNFFVRFNNQLLFSFFSKSNVTDLVIGKENVLYQKAYIDALLGYDNVHSDKVKLDVLKFKELNDIFKKQHKSLLLVIAPGKASIYPEYLPDSIKLNNEIESNYTKYIKELKNCGLPFFDAKQLILERKKKEKFPLFPRTGIHWSGYAVTLVMDTLCKFIEFESGFDLVNFNSQLGTVTNKELRFTDNDMGRSMNLLFPIEDWKMYYPNIVFEKNSNKFKPNLLSIGDSFNQSFFGFYPYFDEVFGKDSQFWYYNKVVDWPYSLRNKFINVNQLMVADEISKMNIIMIVTTEQNLSDFGFGFINSALDALSK